MMHSAIYNVIEKMNELEKKADHYYDIADHKADAGNTTGSEQFIRKAEDIGKEIAGMESCLKILGLNAWRECGPLTNYIGKWHVPNDDIERVC